MDIGDYSGWAEKGPEMESLVQVWPILSGIVLVVALMIAWRAEITVRVKVLEEKVQSLFELLNRRK